MSKKGQHRASGRRGRVINVLFMFHLRLSFRIEITIWIFIKFKEFLTALVMFQVSDWMSPPSHLSSTSHSLPASSFSYDDILKKQFTHTSCHFIHWISIEKSKRRKSKRGRCEMDEKTTWNVNNCWSVICGWFSQKKRGLRFHSDGYNRYHHMWRTLIPREALCLIEIDFFLKL